MLSLGLCLFKLDIADENYEKSKESRSDGSMTPADLNRVTLLVIERIERALKRLNEGSASATKFVFKTADMPGVGE